MTKKQEQDLPGAKPRSDKAHKPMPPREIEPEVDDPRDKRGEAGQFTGEGAPGLQKR